jgi:hypothetical protein
MLRMLLGHTSRQFNLNAVRVRLAVIIILAMIDLGCVLPLAAQDIPLKPIQHIRLHCDAKVILVNEYGHGAARDSWVAECSITDGTEEVWKRELASPIGMSRNECLHLIDRWMAEGAYDLLRTYGYDVQVKRRKR